jgi:hypothetical protein
MLATCPRYVILVDLTIQTISRRRWEDNIKMDLREIGWEGVDWLHLAQDRDQWRAVVSFIKGGEFLDWLSDC